PPFERSKPPRLRGSAKASQNVLPQTFATLRARNIGATYRKTVRGAVRPLVDTPCMRRANMDTSQGETSVPRASGAGIIGDVVFGSASSPVAVCTLASRSLLADL